MNPETFWSWQVISFWGYIFLMGEENQLLRLVFSCLAKSTCPKHHGTPYCFVIQSFLNAWLKESQFSSLIRVAFSPFGGQSAIIRYPQKSNHAVIGLFIFLMGGLFASYLELNLFVEPSWVCTCFLRGWWQQRPVSTLWQQKKIHSFKM